MYSDTSQRLMACSLSLCVSEGEMLNPDWFMRLLEGSVRVEKCQICITAFTVTREQCQIYRTPVTLMCVVLLAPSARKKEKKEVKLSVKNNASLFPDVCAFVHVHRELCSCSQPAL